MRLWLSRLCAATLFGAASLALSLPGVRAEPAVDIAELEARLLALGRLEAVDESVARPLTLAREAIGRVRAASARADRAAAGRATELAQAALELAETRLSLLRERALLRATEARRVLAERAYATAERALERERARLRDLRRDSGEP